MSKCDYSTCSAETVYGTRHCLRHLNEHYSDSSTVLALLRHITSLQTSLASNDEVQFNQWEDAKHVEELEALCNKQEAALRSALIWFSGFGYNKWGVACIEDIPNHQPIIDIIKAALARQEIGGTMSHPNSAYDLLETLRAALSGRD